MQSLTSEDADTWIAVLLAEDLAALSNADTLPAPALAEEPS